MRMWNGLRIVRSCPAICRSLLLLACLLSVLVVGSSSGGHGLDHHLAVLRVVEGVSAVKDFGKEGNHAEQFGVILTVRTMRCKFQ